MARGPKVGFRVRRRSGTASGFSAQHRAGAGPKSWKTSVGKATNAWSSTRRPRTGRRKRPI